MPPKATRLFTVDAATGEVRCQDPSCAVTQCGQCNKEQNARRRAAKKMANQAAATAQKELDAQAAIAQARADAAAGKEHTWTFDREEASEGNLALQALEKLMMVSPSLTMSKGKKTAKMKCLKPKRREAKRRGITRTDCCCGIAFKSSTRSRHQ